MNEAPPATSAGSLNEPDAVLLRAVLDSIPGRVSIIDTQDRYLYANRELLDFLGRTASELIGTKLVDLLGESAMLAFAPARDKALAGQVAKFEGWVDYLGRGRRYVKQVLTPYRPREGEVEGFFFVGRDQTEWREREIELARQTEALRISEATRAAVVVSALDCIIVIDETGKVIEFNPAAEATFGYHKSFAAGRLIADLIIPPDQRARHEAGLRRYLKTGKAAVLGKRIEVEAMRADRSLFPAELAVTEMPVSCGRLFAAHVRDLTAAKAAQAEIEKGRERLHQAEKMAAMGSLLAGVAHELNNPLAILVAQATLLDLKAETEQVKQRARHIHAAAQRCGRIVKSFLAMARQKAPERRAVDLNEIVRSALEISEYGRRSSGIEVELALSDGLVAIDADPDLLGQVVTNLLLNAAQALRDQPQPRRIRVATEREDKTLKLIIADNGPGVAPAIRHRIFEAYFTTKPAGAGTGIGLSLSKDIVEAHKGRIAVGDRDGGGAEFSVVLPIGTVSAETPAAAMPRPSGVFQILIVDDEPEVGAALADLLADLGHNAAVESDPVRALDRLKTERCDMIFTDLHMPGLNGLELRRMIGESDASLARRTIIVTGDTVAGPNAISGSPGQADAIVLEKPFTLEEVGAAVQRAATEEMGAQS